MKEKYTWTRLIFQTITHDQDIHDVGKLACKLLYLDSYNNNKNNKLYLQHTFLKHGLQGALHTIIQNDANAYNTKNNNTKNTIKRNT